MAMEETALRKALDALDTSAFFLLCVLASVCLSLRVLDLQRRQFLAEDNEAGDPFPLQLGASALALGALGYFFSLALERLAGVGPEDGAECRSARVNALASALVLAAALLRLGDLLENRGRESPEDEELPAF